MELVIVDKIFSFFKFIIAVVATVLALSLVILAFLFAYYILNGSFEGIGSFTDENNLFLTAQNTIVVAILGTLAIFLIVKLFDAKTKKIRSKNMAIKKQLEKTEQDKAKFYDASLFQEVFGVDGQSSFFEIRYFNIAPDLISSQNLIERWLPHLKCFDTMNVKSMDDELCKWRVSSADVGVCAKPDAIFNFNTKYIVVEYKSYPSIDFYQLDHALLQNAVSTITYALQNIIDLNDCIAVLRLNTSCYNVYELSHFAKYYHYYVYLINQNKHIFSKYVSLQNELISATDLSKIIYLGEANEINNLQVLHSDKEFRGDIHHCKMACAKTLNDKSFANQILI